MILALIERVVTKVVDTEVLNRDENGHYLVFVEPTKDENAMQTTKILKDIEKLVDIDEWEITAVTKIKINMEVI